MVHELGEDQSLRIGILALTQVLQIPRHGQPQFRAYTIIVMVFGMDGEGLGPRGSYVHGNYFLASVRY